MIIGEQINVVKKYIKYLKDNKDKWVSSGKVEELSINYDIECLEYVVNSLTVLEKFKKDLASKG